MQKNNTFTSRLVYPAVISINVALHYLLISLGWDILPATYVPVLTSAAMVTLLEYVLPYRTEWKPSANDARNDIAFMLAVQIVLPKLLAFALSIFLLQTVESKNLTLNTPWPHDWPIVLQALLMLLVADFLRYWVHRAAHEWVKPLWRLHAVHHSPKKLYWINVGRFHPIEKAIQYLFDTLPFVLIGVTEDVLALYFVFYAVNGFFQHGNIDVRFGWLNYIISGPELHRWHHSRIIRESNSNYGNNVIVWDILFGTYFRPNDRSVDELGLINRQYPLDFLSQMKTPFIKNLDKQR